MSALLDDLPLVPVPPQARRRASLRLVEVPVEALAGPIVAPPPVPAAPVRTAAGPAQRSSASAADAAPLRLTRRGILVLSAAVAVLAAALIGTAWLSAPASAGRTPVSTVVGNTVAVAPGDTLWSIAGRVAPNRDPRAEVADLQQLNHLTGSALVPGQVLRVH